MIGKTKKKETDVGGGGFQLARLNAYFLLVVALLLSILAISFDYQEQQNVKSWQQDKNKFALQTLSAKFQLHVNKLINRIDALAVSLKVVSLDNMSEDTLQRLEADILAKLPDAITFRLVENATVDEKTDMSFAAKHLVGIAAKGEIPPAAIYPGREGKEVLLVRSVSNTHQFVIRLKLSQLKQIFHKIIIDGGLELRQYPEKGNHFVVWKKGLANASQPLLIPLEGSRWQLAFWPPQLQADFLKRIVNGSTFAVCFLLLAIILIFTMRQFNRLLRHDLVVLINLFRDMQENRPGGNYPVKLGEFRDTVDVLLRIKSENKSRSPTMANKLKKKPEVDLENADVDELLFGQKKTMDKIQQQMPEVPLPASIFRAYDIRGRAGSDITQSTARQIGRAVGSEALELKQDTVVVARDGRISGAELSQGLMDGLVESGCNVIDIGMVPTPVLYFAIIELKTNCGVMLTGSHNPPDYNGFKIVIDGETLSGEKIQNLRHRIETKKLASGQGKLSSQQLTNTYIKRISGGVELQKKIKVVIDSGNGVAGMIAPRLFHELGCEVIPLHCEVDGRFPNHHPDPSQPENLMDLIKSVKENNADLGMAFDGDGDRLGIVTDLGEIIWPDRQLMLFALDVLSRNPGAEIIYDVKCTKHLADVIQNAGGQPLMWKTGHSFIKARLKKSGAMLAGEMSGHIFFKERWYGFDDALYAGARLLEIMSRSKKSISEVFSGFPNSINTPELRVDLVEGEHYQFMDKLVSEAAFPKAKIITIDGLRVEFDNGWGLVRASNTTPSLVLRFEADSEAALKQIQLQFRELLLKINANLKLPF